MSTVLVVDDNSINAALYQKIIARIPGAVPACFTDPLAALNACTTALPSALVVDYRMPGIDGLEFIRRFRALPGAANIPVVMLTSIEHPALWQQALDAGACAYLAKPVDPARFIKMLSGLLAGETVTTARAATN